jgi:hypothetical protein
MNRVCLANTNNKKKNIVGKNSKACLPSTLLSKNQRLKNYLKTMFVKRALKIEN